MNLCMQKFFWVKQQVNNRTIDVSNMKAVGKENPACVLARSSDDHKMRRREWKDNTQERCMITNEANNKLGW